MKEITKEQLQKIKEEYKNNKIYTLSRCALNKNKISDLVRVGEQSEYVGNNFSIDIETMKVANQKNSGRCWIFAGLNILREKVAKKYNIEEFELSQNYVAFYDKLEKCNYFLNSVIELASKDKDDRLLSFILMRGIEDGGQWDMFVNVVKKYGVVPKQVFPETFQSENTSEIDNVLNRYLRKTTFKIRKLYKDGNTEKIAVLKDKTMEEIYKLLCSAFGIPPESFSFEYVDKNKKYNILKNITPLEFLNEFVDINLDEYTSIINSPTSDKPFNETYTIKYLGNVIEGKKILHLNLDYKRFKELVLTQLKDRQPVWFGSDCSKYGDRDIGLWDDKSYNESDLLQINLEMSKEEMLDMRESAMNHAMIFTGVNIDNDVVTKWKIENSWGDEKANKGYYIATDSWFDSYVYQAVINKKYLTAEEKNKLEEEPKELEPWDPMGTLA
ncbi:MAG: C1 family peptidase [Bacilli bacterium]|nr:C1 family peptidase [Bacilli bacterium]